jgi:hypothetical protein
MRSFSSIVTKLSALSNVHPEHAPEDNSESSEAGCGTTRHRLNAVNDAKRATQLVNTGDTKNSLQRKSRAGDEGTSKASSYVDAVKHKSDQKAQTADKMEQISNKGQLQHDSASSTHQLDEAVSHNNFLRKENQKARHHIVKLQEFYKKAMSQNAEIHGTLVRPWLEDRESVHVAGTKQRTFKSILLDIRQETVENRVLQEQLRELQQEMLAKVEKVQSTPDEQFAQDFRSLAAAIKGLSRSIDPGLLEKKEDDFKEFFLVQNVPIKYWTSRSRKKCLVEAILWSDLLALVFYSPFAVFGEIGGPLRSLWSDVFGDDQNPWWPRPSTRCETWRCTTVEQLLERVDREELIHGRKTEAQDSNSRLQKSVSDARALVRYQIESISKWLATDFDGAKVQAVVDKAFALAISIATQRSRLQIICPSIGQQYRQGWTPSLVSIPESEDVTHGHVGFIVNPGLRKWGDAHGQNLDQWLDVVPSLVYIEQQPEAEAAVACTSKYSGAMQGDPQADVVGEEGLNVSRR